MASTYSLNNGFELITDGEQTGTWGGTTNTNWELAGESLDGIVTVTLPAVGSTGSPNDVPVTDGVTSTGRHRHVIFADAGDLGGTAYVRLTPNDAEKIWFVRNSLSGSRDILLFQGTYNASNDLLIPNGRDMMVAFNGGGTGAVVTQIDANPVATTLEVGTGGLSINGTAVTSTAAELNILDGVTSTAAELNILDGVTSTTAELNILDGVTATASEINNLSGVSGTVATTTSPSFTGTVSSAGAVVIGGSLEAWHADYDTILQIQGHDGTDAGLTLASSGAGNARFYCNAYYDGTNWRRSGAGFASAYEMHISSHNWDTAATGAADSIITWATDMHLSPDGVLVVGTDQTMGAAAGGDLIVNGGVFLGGTSSAHYLDDYEEGSWTPSMNFDGAASGLTYDQRIGKYTKVGRLVRCYGIITLTSKGSSTGQVFFEGLPFTVGSVFSGVNDMTCGFAGQLTNALGAGINGFPVLTSTETTTKITPKEMNDGALFHTNIYDPQIGNTFEIRFTFEYMTA